MERTHPEGKSKQLRMNDLLDLVKIMKQNQTENTNRPDHQKGRILNATWVFWALVHGAKSYGDQRGL